MSLSKATLCNKINKKEHQNGKMHIRVQHTPKKKKKKKKKTRKKILKMHNNKKTCV